MLFRVLLTFLQFSLKGATVLYRPFRVILSFLKFIVAQTQTQTQSQNQTITLFFQWFKS